MHVHDVSALEGFTVKILCGNFWNRELTPRPALHLTQLLLHVGFASQTEHTPQINLTLSQAVTIVLSTRQATFVTTDFFLPSGMREHQFFCYIYQISHQVYLKILMRNLDSTRLTTIQNGKVKNQLVLFHCTLIHPIGVCHSISLIGMQYAHYVSFNSGWLEFLDYLWPLKLGPIGHLKVLLSSCQLCTM